MINVDVKVWVIQLYYGCLELLASLCNGLWIYKPTIYGVDDNVDRIMYYPFLRYYLHKYLQ